ncbi:MAG: CAAX prenyl protease-related protein [Planctomycetales bacterium]|nr:CAAX prenyl protease-related protein [Planctomycetales bacterium]
MTPSNSAAAPTPTNGSVGNPPLPAGWLSRWPWVTFVLPLAVYMLAGSLEPSPPPAADASAVASEDSADPLQDVAEMPAETEAPAAESRWPHLPYSAYPLVYTVKLVLTLAVMIAVWPGYRAFHGRISPLALLVGVVGAVLWIVLSELQLERKIGPWAALLDMLGLGGSRASFNPLEQLADNPAWAYGFLAIRLAGLALIVPVIEEFFLRGFLMRFVMHPNWPEVPFGSVNGVAVAVGTAFPMLYHPEQLAALVWFSLVTWLMVRTKNIWDCVVAHAVTNGLLGAYVIATGSWHLM